MVPVMKKYINLVLVLLVSFALTACNEGKNQASPELSATSTTSNPLTDLLKDSSKPAVIKFHAEWCSTCKHYAPKFEAAKKEFPGTVDFYNIDVDDSRYKALVKYAKISRIPDTLFVSADRQNVSRKLGSIPRTKLISIINGLSSN